jgi:hypothetical protein
MLFVCIVCFCNGYLVASNIYAVLFVLFAFITMPYFAAAYFFWAGNSRTLLYMATVHTLQAFCPARAGAKRLYAAVPRRWQR